MPWLRQFTLLSLLCALVLRAQQPEPQPAAYIGQRVAEVVYLPPDILHPADLDRVRILKEGDTLSSENVGTAIDRLFATGQFSDIVAEVEPAPSGGVRVRFVTTPALFVGGVTIRGKVSQPPTRGELASNTRLTLGNRFSDRSVDSAVSRLKTLLQANGFYENDVTSTRDLRDQGQQVFFSFRARSGKRAKYDMPVISGDTKMSQRAIVRASGWRYPLIHIWRHVTDARTRGGIQGILSKYQKQDRLTAHVELEKLNYDPTRRRVIPVLSIDAGPKIRVVAVETKVSKGVIRRYVPVYQERAVDNDLLVEGARNLRDYFQNKGYFDVDVDFREQPLANDERTIEYVIARGNRYKLANVNLVGVNYFEDEDLRERMFLHEAGFISMRHGRYSEAFRKKDAENIENLYKANGFRDVKVTTTVDRSKAGNGGGDVSVTVQVNEGTQWLVDSVELNGIVNGDLEYLRSRLASQEGQPFAEVNMAADRNMILTWYYSNGYPAATFKAEWKPSTEVNHVTVRYTVTEGERQFVRDVFTSGQSTTREDLITKRITLHPGDPLSPVEQTAIQRAFYDMGVFARVDTAIENADGDTTHKYLLYNFEEANRYTLALGFGAQIGRFGSPSSSSLSAPAGSTGFSPLASLNLSRLNFMGLGHTITFRGVYSNLQQRASISYLAPRFRDVNGRNFTASLLYDNSLNVRTFASKRQEASVQISQQISKSTTLIGRVAYRRVSVTDVIIPVLLVPQLVQPVRLGLVAFNIAQDRRDDPANPHRGIYNTGDISISGRYLGSERSFLRVLMRNATYHRITRTVVLARQTQFGLIHPYSVPANITADQSVPLPERFFGGGSDSLRAFPFNQAGPRDIGTPLVPGGPSSQPTGFPLGGNALLFNNVELRFPFLGPNIQGVLFHDMGNVYTSLSKLAFRSRQRDLTDFDYLVHAAGIGIRYRTPVGPIRADVAYTFNPPSYLGFGGTSQELLQCDPNKPASQLPGFCTPTRQSVGHIQFFFSIGQTF